MKNLRRKHILSRSDKGNAMRVEGVKMIIFPAYDIDNFYNFVVQC